MTRLHCAWAVLRGRPVAYRLHIRGAIELGPLVHGAWIADNVLVGYPPPWRPTGWRRIFARLAGWKP